MRKGELEEHTLNELIDELKIIPTPNFSKSVKRLAKKYKSIATDLEILQNELTSKTYQAIELENHCFKMRLANISSIPTGKSGGFRMIFLKSSRKKSIF